MLDPSVHLTLLKTQWSIIDRARGVDEAAIEARNQLLERYYYVVRHFLERKLPRDANAVGEVLGLFSQGVIEGHKFLFQADQKLGKFRHYLKRVLTNKITDYYRRGTPQALEPEVLEGTAAPDAESDAENQLFLESCAQEVLDRGWSALQKHETKSGQPFYTICKCHYAEKEMRSKEKAALVSKQLNKEITPENFRKLVERGEQKLADFLVEEVARELRPFAPSGVTKPMIEEDLRELNLHRFCEKALERYQSAANP